MEESVLMLEPARRKIANLAALAMTLNKKSDEFTEQLKTIESELGQHNLGIEVTVGEPLELGDLEVGEHEEQVGIVRARWNKYLAYGRGAYPAGSVQSRTSGTWGFIVRTSRDFYGPNDELIRSVFTSEQALLGAARELRIAAAEQIDVLLDLLFAEVRKKLAALDKALDKK